MATSPLPSQSPHGGERSIWLHHPCLLTVPMVGRDQYGYITPAFLAFPWWGEINMAMRQRIRGSHTPPCHTCMVITTQFSVLPCCRAAQTSSVPLQVAADCALVLAICTFASARTHHPPTVPVSL